MLFKIVILATYIFKEGPWPAPITEHLGGGILCAQHNWDQITQVYVSAGSAVGDISIQQGDQVAIQGVTGQTKIYNL